MLRLLLALAIWGTAAGASAQTTEEAVALLAWGMEAGHPGASPCGRTEPPMVVSTSPARYRFDCGAGESIEMVVRQLDSCRFETFYIWSGDKDERRDILDFSKFERLAPAGAEPELGGHRFEAGPGFCTASDGPDCLIGFLSMVDGQCCVLAPGGFSRQRVEAALSLVLTDRCER